MSLLNFLLESESAINDNHAVSAVISELAAVQESGEAISDKIVYTAESVPVFRMPHNGKSIYVIECDNLFKLMNCQDKDVSAALSDIKSNILLSDPEVTFDTMGILINNENIEQIEETCKKDKSKIGARTEEITEYSNILKSIKSEGVHLLVNR